MSLQQTGNVTEAFKPGQVPGAQTNDDLLAGQPSALTAPDANNTPDAAATSDQPGQPAPPAASSASVDKQLGGLY
jgi:penicillin-binding protein 1A